MLVTMNWTIFPFLLFLFGLTSAKNTTSCNSKDFFLHFHQCPHDPSNQVASTTPVSPIYLLYDINPSEGFNLRRDVYIRLAVFLRGLQKHRSYANTKLVLPPWSALYHWRSSPNQMHIPWAHFFDLDSMRRYADVIEMHQFFDEYRRNVGRDISVVRLDEFYRLQHFEDMFENGVFVDKFEEAACQRNSIPSVGGVPGIMGYRNITINELICMRFQGSASLLHSMFEKFKHKSRGMQRVIMLYHAETILHDHWGNADYWEARRSMRFNKQLVRIADKFRLDFFNSSNERDRVQRPASWTEERPYRKARGGEYLCAHLRRADFLYGREKTTPSLRSASNQIKQRLLELGLRKVFISSDCDRTEFHELKNYLRRFKVVRFIPESRQEAERLKDGGVAIVDQIICSHARYFVGTYESTFTYRIYEEREILGFAKDLTFNTFCKDEEVGGCEKNSVWPIQYG
ncbi:GDP-fucose protein O-fucosyltransferase 2 [Topomyia yanbarensis]|uniref:GDP-fucose protein O-fucosyltransferase 2 n=1 Tax=Topomyia yanbarensis TaxID=2498891 RepID=UPI00273BF703|nr:GDP-fucose protein O-fucosyltransferase 2 [Topomyia yanbarensis]